MSSLWGDLSTLCANYRDFYVQNTVLTVVASVSVSMVNFLMKLVLKALSGFERYKGITQMEESIMMKLWFVFFINMGILIVAINADLSSFSVVKNIQDGLGTTVG